MNKEHCDKELTDRHHTNTGKVVARTKAEIPNYE